MRSLNLILVSFMLSGTIAQASTTELRIHRYEGGYFQFESCDENGCRMLGEDSKVYYLNDMQSQIDHLRTIGYERGLGYQQGYMISQLLGREVSPRTRKLVSAAVYALTFAPIALMYTAEPSGRILLATLSVGFGCFAIPRIIYANAMPRLDQEELAANAPFACVLEQASQSEQVAREFFNNPKLIANLETALKDVPAVPERNCGLILHNPKLVGL